MSVSKLPIITLLLLSALAAYCIIGLQVRNGFFQLVDEANSEKSPRLPGSSHFMLTEITGFAAIDKHIRGMLIFFWPTVSGESLSLSLFAFYIVGQILPMHTLLLLEGLRPANFRRVISYTTVWGVLYQTVPWGVIMPIYFAIYLWTSPITQGGSSKSLARSLSIDPIDLAVLPIALTIGFITPTILAAIPPPLVTTVLQQQFLLLWQGFPIWTALCQYFLSKVSLIVRQSSQNTKSSRAETNKLLRRVYAFTLSVTALVRITTIILAIAASVRPEFFSSPSREVVGLKTVFLPLSPFSNAKVERLAEGCLNLLQHDMYFACGAGVIWATVILRGINPESPCWGSAMKALVLSLLVGPGGAALALVWERDERILRVEKGIEGKDGKES